MTVAGRPLALAAALLLGVTAAGTAGAATGGTGPTATPPGPALPALSVRQLVGQHMVFSYAGATPPFALERRIRAGEAAGVILFGRNIASRARLRGTIARLQAIPRPAGLGAPLLVMIDQEGGYVKRLSGAPSRSPAAVGRTGSTAVARAEGTATARNLRGVGVNVNLAPVLDTGRPGSFSERLERSYSRDPAKVAGLGTAFAGALRAGGVAATAKHFPGIGVPRVDEDAVASRIGLSQATLRRIDEAPFAAASPRPHRPGDARHRDLPRVRPPAGAVLAAAGHRRAARPARLRRRVDHGRPRDRGRVALRIAGDAGPHVHACRG